MTLFVVMMYQGYYYHLWAEDRKLPGIFSPVLAAFALSSFLLFFFFLGLLGLLACINGAATIIVAAQNDSVFEQALKLTMFFSGFAFFCHIFPLCIYVLQDFDSDEYNKYENVYTRFFRGTKETKAAKENDKDTKPAKVDPELIQQKQLNRFYLNLSFAVTLLFAAITPQILASKLTGSDFTSDATGRSFRMFRMYLHRDQQNLKDIETQQDDSHTYYSACGMRWGKLSALDHALLAQIAYFKPEQNVLDPTRELEGMKKALQFAFPEDKYDARLTEDWHTRLQTSNAVSEDMFNAYYKIDFHDRKHTVIAVQGTNPESYYDVFADLRLWTMSFLMDVAEWVFPPLNLISRQQRAYLQGLIDRIQRLITIQAGTVR